MVINRLLSHFKEKWTELVFELLFVACGAALGVYLGFNANNKSLQDQSNQITSIRLHAMYLEMNNVNIQLAMNLIVDEKSSNMIQTRITRISLDSARSVFSDHNIHNVLPPEQILLIQNYIHLGAELDYWNQAYIRILENNNYDVSSKPNVLALLYEFKKKTINNAIKFAAESSLLLQDLPKYFDKTAYSLMNTKVMKQKIGRRIKAAKDKVIKGEFPRPQKLE